MPYKQKENKKIYDKLRYKARKNRTWIVKQRQREYQLWTKQEIKKLIELWNTHTIAELCKEIDRNRNQIIYMACQIRKSGYPLSRKSTLRVYNGLVKEAIKEYTKPTVKKKNWINKLFKLLKT